MGATEGSELHEQRPSTSRAVLPAPMQEFMRRVNQEVLPLGVHDHLVLARLWALHPRNELRAALASVLATDGKQWEEIVRRFDACIPPELLLPPSSEPTWSAAAVRAESPPVPAAPTDTVGRDDTPTRLILLRKTVMLPAIAAPLTARAGWRRRLRALLLHGGIRLPALRSRLRAGRRLLLFAALGALVTAGFLATVYWIAAPQLPAASVTGTPPSTAAAEPAPALDPGQPPTRDAPAAHELDPASPAPRVPTLLQEMQGSQDVPMRERPPQLARPLSWRAWVLLAGLAYLLALFGSRWLLLPAQVRFLQEALIRFQEERGHRQRVKLAEEALHSGQPLRPVYRFEAVLPFLSDVLEDCAGLLGRSYLQNHGLDLDVEATLNATLESGGQLAPVFASVRSGRELVVLIDFEGGDHPWLSGFLRVLDFWRRQGLQLVLLRFDRRPERLTLLPSRGIVSLHDLARVHDRAMLLIFSRQLSVLGAERSLCWTQALESWPLRAWLDPDPRPLCERHYEQQRDIDYLEQRGLVRFPYTESGLLTLARYFAMDGVGVSPPPWEPLPDLRGERLRAALKRWAALGALVPDASWDQLDVLRRAFLAKELGESRYVHHLIDFVSQRIGQAADCGAVLLIPAEEEDRLRRSLRADADPGTDPDCLEALARKLLLQQLGSTMPGAGMVAGGGKMQQAATSLASWIWLLKVSGHRAVLAPQLALDYYLPLLGSPVDAEARQLIKQELQLRPSRLPRLERLLGHRSDIMLRELWTGQPALWRRAGLLALLLVTLTLLIGAGLPQLALRAGWLAPMPRATLPAILIVRERGAP